MRIGQNGRGISVLGIVESRSSRNLKRQRVNRKKSPVVEPTTNQKNFMIREINNHLSGPRAKSIRSKVLSCVIRGVCVDEGVVENACRHIHHEHRGELRFLLSSWCK